MKKICVALMLIMLTGTSSFGAVSDDIYVRKDVFEVHMQSINAKLDMMLEQMKEFRAELKAQRQDINELTKAVSVLSARVDGVEKNMLSLDKRIDDIWNVVYLWLVAIGIFFTVLAWPKVQEKLKAFWKSTPSITLEDVKRLIEEHDAELRKSLQL